MSWVKSFCLCLFSLICTFSMISSVWAEIIFASPPRGNRPNLTYHFPDRRNDMLVRWGGFRADFTSGITLIATGDVDADGTTDVILVDPITVDPITGSGGTAVPSNARNIRIYDQSGTLRYEFRLDDPHLVPGFQVAVGNADGDRRDEIIIAGDSSTPGHNVLVLKVTDTGSLQPIARFRSSFVPRQTRLAFGDLDANGTMDVVLADPFVLADGREIPSGLNNLRVLAVDGSGGFETRLEDERFVENGGFAVGNLDGLLGAEILVAGDSRGSSGENVSIWKREADQRLHRVRGFRAYFQVGGSILAVGLADRFGSKQVVVVEPARNAADELIPSDHYNVRIYSRTGHPLYNLRFADSDFRAGSTMAVSWMIANNYTYVGTPDDDGIYFGICADCSNDFETLLICRKTGDRTERLELPMGRGDLTIDGRGGNDFIQQVHRENVGLFDPDCVYDSIATLRYSQTSILGSDGNDCLFGSQGTQTLSGGRGGDYLSGSRGDDYLYGGSGNDHLVGDEGRDRLYGGEDNDILQGGAGVDIIDGGPGDDIFRCRTVVNATAAQLEDCQTQGPPEIPQLLSNIQNTQRRDPERQWAFLTNCQHETIHHHLTTSNQQLIRNDAIRPGARILTDNNGNPLRVEHRQYRGTCGPASLSLVLQHLHPTIAQIAPWSLPQDITLIASNSLKPPLPNMPLNTPMVNLGHRFSQEDVMYQCYSVMREININETIQGTLGFVDQAGMLDVGAGMLCANFDIDYSVGGCIVGPAGAVAGRVDAWMSFGHLCGDSELIPTAHNNNTTPPSQVKHVPMDYPHEDGFSSLEHIKAVVRGFIDANIPVVLGLERGGHFNVLIGYWDSSEDFWLYTTDPIEGASRQFHARPMIWRRIRLNDDALRRGANVLYSMILYGQGPGCNPGGWADLIDRHYQSGLLCLP